jgi:hypothetical protein
MRDNFINWLLNIGPTQFSIEQQLPHPPKDEHEPKKKDDQKKDTNPDYTCLGPPRS